MAFNLPVEGEDGPFAGQSLVEVPTCGPADTASDVAARLREQGADRAVVVNDKDVVLGLVALDALEEGAPDAVVRGLMEVSPSTVRPSVLLSSLAERGQDRVLVTSSDGRLLGAVELEEGADDRPPDMQALEKEFLETIFAVEEHFGDHQPTEEELRSFLRDRLLDEGRSPEEADEIMSRLDEGPSEGE
jgi:hypothetical protein